MTPKQPSPFVADLPPDERLAYLERWGWLASFVGGAVGVFMGWGFCMLLYSPPDAPAFTRAIATPGRLSLVRQYEDANHHFWWTFRYGGQTIRVPANCKEVHL